MKKKLLYCIILILGYSSAQAMLSRGFGRIISPIQSTFTRYYPRMFSRFAHTRHPVIPSTNMTYRQKKALEILLEGKRKEQEILANRKLLSEAFRGKMVSLLRTARQRSTIKNQMARYELGLTYSEGVSMHQKALNKARGAKQAAIRYLGIGAREPILLP